MIQSKDLILKINNRQLIANNLILIKDQPSFRLTADTASTAIALVVDNVTGLAANDFVIIGNFGDRTAEIRQVTSITGTSLAITATTYDHYRDTKITRIPYNQIEFSYADTLAGSKTAFSPVTSVSANITDTTKIDPGSGGAFTGRNYYFFRFFNSVTSLFSNYCSGVYYTGNALNTAYSIITTGLNKVGVEIGDEDASPEQLLSDIRSGIDEITHWKRSDSYVNTDWAFEVYTDSTSLVSVENAIDFLFSALAYEPKYSGSKQGFFSLLFSTKPLVYIDPDQMDLIYMDKPNTTLAAQATAGDTSITLTDSNEFEDSGTVYIGSNTVTYTANDTATGILSGIPTSGTGSITTTVTSGGQVWQNITPGEPSRYTVTTTGIRLDQPVDSNLVGYKLKLKYLRKLANITSFQDEVAVPFYDCLSDYVAYSVESRKRNDDKSLKHYSMFSKKVENSAAAYQLPVNTSQTYYIFENQIDERYNDIFNTNN